MVISQDFKLQSTNKNTNTRRHMKNHDIYNTHTELKTQRAKYKKALFTQDSCKSNTDT